jgi:hypothetical protein
MQSSETLPFALAICSARSSRFSRALIVRVGFSATRHMGVLNVISNFAILSSRSATSIARSITFQRKPSRWLPVLRKNAVTTLETLGFQAFVLDSCQLPSS